MRTSLMCAFLLLATAIGSAQTATVTGTVYDPGTDAGSNVTLKFVLGGCAGNQPRVNGVALVTGETDGGNVSKTFAANSSTGAVSDAIIKNSSITCGSSTTSNYWAMYVVRNGVKGPACNVRITTGSFDATQPSCLNQNPTISLSNLSSLIYATLDSSNGPFTGNTLFTELDNTCMASQQTGADAGAKINACVATLPTTGGTVDARGLEGSQAITTAITVDRPVVLLLPNAYFACSASCEFVVTKSLRVIGEMQATNINTRGTTFTMSKAGALFRFPTGASSLVEHFELGNLQVQGGGGSYDNYVVDVPSNSGGSFDGNQARWHFHDLWIANMGSAASTAAAINVGDSIYWVSIEHNVFSNNAGGDVNLGYASDFNITHNYFWTVSTTQQHLRLIGGAHGFVDHNEFENGNSSTKEDILLTSNATSANSSGFIWITDNKFGPESETSTRAKIRAYNASRTTDMIQNIRIINNTFAGVSGSSFLLSAIRYDNPIRDWQVRGNIFDYVTTLMDDEMVESSNQSGNSVFKDNIVKHGTNANSVLCANGCRGFSDVETPSGLSGSRWAYRALPRQTETPELRNRVVDSNIFTCGVTWTCNASTTVTAGQADPFGGTAASLIVNGGITQGYIKEAISNTNLGSRVVLSFWAKAGTASVLTVSMHDTTTNPSADDGLTEVKLSSTWEKYKFSIPIFAPANSWEVRFWPGGETSTASQNIVLYGVQVADYDSDYVATTGAAYSDTTIGTLFRRGVIFGNGGKAVKAIYEGSASLDFDLSTAGITCQDITITVTGAASGDEVKLGIPDALASTAGVLFDAWVSATDTVKVRACDVTSGNPNPAAATVKAEVAHF